MSDILIDISAQGADVNIVARGQDWRIENVGIKGRCDVGSDPSQPVHDFLLNIGGSGTIKNVYLGDGIVDGIKKGALIYSDTGSGDHTTMRDCYIAEWFNAIYAAGGAATGRPTLGVENCYFRDNANTHMRVAEQGTYAADSVFHDTGKVPKLPDGRTPASRGFWPYSYGTTSDTVEIRNCELDFSTQGTAIVADNRWPDAARFHMDGGNLAGPLSGPQPDRIELTDVGTNPDTSIPAGVPTSAEMAASGGGASGSSGSGSQTTTLDNTITIHGQGEVTYFQFSVSGSVAAGDGVEPDDSISNGTVKGGLMYDDDSYKFSGQIESFEYLQGGPVPITVNGTTYDATSVVGQPQDLSNTLTIQGLDQVARYEFTVDGDLEATASADGFDTWDTVSGSSASGWIAGSSTQDSYRFSGSITDFSFSLGDAKLFLNGSEVDPATFEPTTTNTLTINGTDQVAQYQFTVDGDVSPDSSDDAFDTWDTLQSNSVTGWVGSSSTSDSFSYTGSITDFSFPIGEAEVYHNGTKVSPQDLL